MAANLITIDAGVVSPFLDAIMQELYTSGGGIITGGTITISGASTLHITQTHGALCGREFSIDDGDYTVQLSSSGTLLGRIYLHMDLANVATPLEVLVETGASLTPVVQDANVNETNGVYEINLATFEVDESTISNLVNVAPTIKTLAARTLQTVEDCTNSTDPQDIAGASAISELNSKIADYSNLTLLATKTVGGWATTNVSDITQYKELIFVIAAGNALLIDGIWRDFKIVPVDLFKKHTSSASYMEVSWGYTGNDYCDFSFYCVSNTQIGMAFSKGGSANYIAGVYGVA